MTSKLEVVRNYLDAAWSNPPESLLQASITGIADDFVNVDEDGNVVMNKEAYIGMGQMMFTAFKDFRFVVADLREVDDGVLMTGHFAGTHTDDLDLSAMGLGVVPASGKKIDWDEVTVKWVLAGDQIAREEPYAGATGIAAFLTPLGITLPS